MKSGNVTIDTAKDPIQKFTTVIKKTVLKENRLLYLHALMYNKCNRLYCIIIDNC